MAGLDAGDVQHVVDQGQQMPARLQDGLDPAALLVGGGQQGRVAQQLGEAEHGVQRRAQLVAHAREELGLGPAGRGRHGHLLARRIGLLAQAHGFGDVAVDEEHAVLAALGQAAHGHQAVDQLSVLAAHQHLHGIDLAAALELVHQLLALLGPGPDAQGRAGAAQRLFAGVACHQREAVVDVDVEPVGDAGDAHGIGRGLVDLLEALLRGTLHVLLDLARMDVLVGAHHQQGLAPRPAPHHPAARQHPAPLALAVAQAVLVEIGRAVRCQGGHGRGDGRLGIVGVQQIAPVLQAGLEGIGLVAELLVVARAEIDAPIGHMPLPLGRAAALQRHLQPGFAELAFTQGLAQALQVAPVSGQQGDQQGHAQAGQQHHAKSQLVVDDPGLGGGKRIHRSSCRWLCRLPS
eukprot:Opistho-1_new@108703